MTAAWLGVGSFVVAPVILLIVPRRRRQPEALLALDAEAEVWCAGETRGSGRPPFVAWVPLPPARECPTGANGTFNR
jgi:hypothetical protein